MKRGSIWSVNLDPGFGREIRKKRPALIISGDTFNKSLHTIIIIPFSSQQPSALSQEIVTVFPNKLNGLSKKSVLLPVFVRSIDKSRLIKKVGVLTSEKLEEVEEALKIVLGFVPLD